MALPARLGLSLLVLLPILSAAFWLATLLGLLLSWHADGYPRYASMQDGQTVAYISDVGAQRLQPLFIAGCVLTTVSLDAALVADRVLRHRRLLAAGASRAAPWLSAAALVCALAGTVGLILLSIFDTLRHQRLHNSFLGLFIIGYVLAAAFLCAEFQRLGMKYRQHRTLRLSFWTKLLFVLVAVALAVVFGVCSRLRAWNASAVAEWVVGIVFVFWILSFAADLWPAVRGDQRDAVPRLKGAAAAAMAGVGGGGPGADRYAAGGTRLDEEYGAAHYGAGGYRGATGDMGVRPNPAGNF